MAFPNNIKSSGSLSQSNDLFEYFKGGLLENSISGDTNREQWPVWLAPDFLDYQFFNDNASLIVGIIHSNTTLPITRKQFYDYVDAYTIYPRIMPTGTQVGFFANTLKNMKLYTYQEPDSTSNWNIKMLNDFGKIKSMELALFGDNKNGEGLTDSTLSKYDGMTLRNSVSNWTLNKLSYIRTALVRFEAYGEYSKDINLGRRLPPTDLIVDDVEKTLDFTYSEGFEDYSFYEASYDQGYTWDNIISKPVYAPIGGIPVNGFWLRLKADDIYQESTHISNSEAISPSALYIDAYLYVDRIDAFEISIGVSCNASDPVPVNINLGFNVIVTVGGNQIGSFLNVTILSGQKNGSSYESVLASGSITDYYINSHTVDPSVVNGVPIIVNY